MVHTVFLIMVITSNSDLPRQMAAEPTLEACLRDIQQFAAEGAKGKNSSWYCQQAVKNGPG
jgi:hypothetical protein